MRYVTLALTALALVSCSRDAEYLKQRNLTRGNDYFKAGKFKEASIMYRNAIANDRKFGEAYYRLALTQMKLGDPMGSFRPLRIAVELLTEGTPDANDATLKLAEIEIGAAASTDKNDQYIKDVDDFAKKFLQRNPNSWEGHKLSGDLAFLKVRKLIIDQKPLDAKKSLADSVSEYRASLASHPGDYATTIALARALEIDGELPESETIFNGLTNKEKQNTTAYLDLFRLYLRERKLPEAEALLKRAIQNNPKDSGLRIDLAQYYLGTNKRDELVVLLNQMKSDLKQFPDAYVQAGDFFMRVNQFDEAIKQYEEGVKKRSGPEAHLPEARSGRLRSLQPDATRNRKERRDSQNRFKRSGSARSEGNALPRQG